MGPKVVGGVFAVIGIMCWIAGAHIYSSMREFAAQAVVVEGAVVELQVQRSSHGITYMPVVVYQDAAGKEHTLYSSVSSNPPAFLVGQKVRVLYRPDDPEFPLHAMIESAGQIWGGALFLGLFGSTFFAVGAVVMLLSWKGRALIGNWTYGKGINFGGKQGRDP